MSSIASILSTRDVPVTRAVTASPAIGPTPAAPQFDPAPTRVTPPPRADAPRDPRFDTAAAAAEQAVHQVARQITAGMVYGAHVSVVHTATGIHATIDVSA